MKNAVMYGPAMDVTCRLSPWALVSGYYRVSVGRADMPERREACSPGSVLAFHVLPTTNRIFDPQGLTSNPFQYPQRGGQ